MKVRWFESIIRRLMKYILTLLLVIVLVLLPARAAASSCSASEIVRLTNSTRSVPLSVSSDLSTVAQSWSAEMARAGALSHNPNLASQVSGWQKVGENVGRGPSVSTVYSALLASPAHYANIVDPDWTEIGVGVVQDGNTCWVTQVFRHPAVPKPEPTPSPAPEPKATAAPEPKPEPSPTNTPQPEPEKIEAASPSPKSRVPVVVEWVLCMKPNGPGRGIDCSIRHLEPQLDEQFVHWYAVYGS